MNIYKILYQRFSNTKEIAKVMILYDLKSDLYCSLFEIKINQNEYIINDYDRIYSYNYKDDTIYHKIENTTNKDKLDIIRFIMMYE